MSSSSDCPTGPRRSACSSRWRSTPTARPRARRGPSAAARTSARRSCSPPATGSRSTPTSTTFHGAVTEIGDALAERRPGVRAATSCASTSTSTTRTARSRTPSRSPAAWTRWPSARARSSASCATPLRAAQADGQAGGALNSLFQQALRVGKRAHTETGIDRVSVSLVESGLEHAARDARPAGRHCASSSSAPASMSSLAATTVSRLGARELVIVNRTHAKAERLAARHRRHGPCRSPRWTRALAQADLVDLLHRRGRARGRAAERGRAPPRRPGRRPQVYVDLALPRDVDPAAGALPGVERRRPGRARARRWPPRASSTPHLSRPCRTSSSPRSPPTSPRRRAQTVAPTVAALRSRAADVVAGRADPPRAAAALARRAGPRRGPAGRAPRRREAAAHPDRPGEGARRRAARAATTPRRCATCSTSTRTTSPPCPCPRRRGRGMSTRCDAPTPPPAPRHRRHGRPAGASAPA